MKEWIRYFAIRRQWWLLPIVLLLLLSSVMVASAAPWTRLVEQNMTSNVAPSPYAIGYSTETAGLQAWRAFDDRIGDGNSGTGDFQFAAATGTITFDLGAGNATVVNAYNMTTTGYNGSRQYDWKNWTLSGSNDNSSYTLLDSVAAAGGGTQFATGGQKNQYNFTNAVAYRYYKWTLLQNNGGAGAALIAEIRLLRDMASPANTITLTLNNTVNGSTINGFCVSYTGNGTGANCTTGSSVTITGVTGSLNFLYYNITNGGASPSYFNVTTSATISGSQSIQASTFQSYITMNATRLLLGTGISTFNTTNNLVSNSTSTSTVTILANAGSNNVKVDVGGNYSLNVSCSGTALATTTCTAAGVYDDLFKINATNTISGSPVTSFSLTAVNATFGGPFFNGSTTNGSVFVPLLQGYTYQFQISANGYNPANSSQAANSAANSYTFVLLPTNSIFLFFFDEITLDSIDFQNVSVTFQNSTGSFTNVSSTGSMIQTGLNPDLWTVTVSSTGYSDRQFFLTVTGSTAQDVDVYLLNSSFSQDTTFTMKDGTTTDTISGANMTILNNVGGSWVMLAQAISDAFGVTQFELKPNKQYQFMVTADGYVTRVGNFTVTETDYTIILNNANPQQFTTYNDLFSYVTYPGQGGELNNTVTNFTVTVNSPGSLMDWFAVVVSLNGTNYTQNVTASPAGGSATLSMNLTAYSGYQVTATYYMKADGISAPLVISRSWPIYGFTEGSYTFSGFMTRYEDDANGLTSVSRGLLLTVAAVVLGGLLGFIFGGAAAVLGAALVFIAGAFYGWLHWSIVMVVVGGFLGALLIKGVGNG